MGMVLLVSLFHNLITVTTMSKPHLPIVLNGRLCHARLAPNSLDHHSRVLLHVLLRRPHGRTRRRQIALMERAHLVRLERSNDSMQHATIMEQHEVLFLPVMRVHQLATTSSATEDRQK
jgi:hypothetical protein